MEFISRLINLITIFGNNFLFDDVFFFQWRDCLHRCPKMFYAMLLTLLAQQSDHWMKKTREISNDVTPASHLVLPIVIFCVFFVPIARCPVPRSHDETLFALFLLKFCVKDKTNNASNILNVQRVFDRFNINEFIKNYCIW